MTYDYKCDTCGAGLELEQSIRDECTSFACPRADECTGTMRRQVTGGAGFLLLGYGWTPKGDKFILKADGSNS